MNNILLCRTIRPINRIIGRKQNVIPLDWTLRYQCGIARLADFKFVRRSNVVHICEYRYLVNDITNADILALKFISNPTESDSRGSQRIYYDWIVLKVSDVELQKINIYLSTIAHLHDTQFHEAEKAELKELVQRLLASLNETNHNYKCLKNTARAINTKIHKPGQDLIKIKRELERFIDRLDCTLGG